MRKLLSILASVTMVASASTAVVSCSTDNVQASGDAYANNDLNNILGASLEKAKSVIINSEHGVDTSVTDQQQGRIKVSADNLSNINYNDLANKKDSTVSDLVGQYYGNVDDDSSNTTTGENVDLGGTDGIDSTIDYFLNQAMKALNVSPIIRNAIFRNKKSIIAQLGLTKDTVNMDLVNQLNKQAFEDSGTDNLLNFVGIPYLKSQVIQPGLNKENANGGTGPYHVIAKAIVDVIDNKTKFTDETLPGVFADQGVMHLIRQTMSDLFDKSAFAKSIYENKSFSLPNYSDTSAKADITMDPTKMYDATADGTTGIAQADVIKDIKLTDIKKELLASLDRIAHVVINKELFSSTAPKDSTMFDDTPTDFTGKYLNDLENIIANIASAGIAGQISTSNGVPVINNWNGKQNVSILSDGILKDDSRQKSIMAIVWEVMRDMNIMNAQFSMFEDTYNAPSTDSMHLFGPDVNGKEQTNYQYLNGLINDVKDKDGNVIAKAKFKNLDKATLADTDYLSANLKADNKDPNEPINFNYFYSNLNYYIGGLTNNDDAAVYRFQKLMFIVMNDPMKAFLKNGSTSLDDWTDKQSDLLGFISSTALKVGMNYLQGLDQSATGDNKTKYDAVIEALKNVLADQPTMQAAQDKILKPIFLGLINGNNFQPLFKMLYGGLNGAKSIPSVATLFDSLRPLGINMDDVIKAVGRLADNKQIGHDTIHSLFTVDFRSILKPLTFIPQAWMDKLFGPDKPVNLFTLVQMPLSKILSIAGVPAFLGGKVSPVGGYFTLQSIPWLINFLNDKVLNNVNDNVPLEYGVKDKDGNLDLSKSLKSRDFNSQALYDLFISFVGKSADGKDNIISKALRDWITASVKGLDPNYDNFDKAVDIKFNMHQAVMDLGIIGETAVANPSKAWAKETTRFDDSKDSGKGGGDAPVPMTIQIQYDSLVGGFYRLNLPYTETEKVDSSTNAFTMQEKDLSVDFLHQNYSNFIGLLQQFDNPAHYEFGEFTKQILTSDKAFSFNYDPQSIKYSQKYRNLIKGFTFTVTYKNYVVGETNQYIFTVSRDSNIEAFKITNMITNKID